MNIRELVGWPLIVFAFIFAITNGVLTVRWLNSSSDPGWVEASSGNRRTVLRVRSELADRLQPGDEILLIDDKPINESFSIYQFFEKFPPGREYNLRIKRGGETHNLRVATLPFSNLARFGLLVTVVLVPFVFYVSGFLLFILSQGEKRLILIAVALALTIPEVPLFSFPSVTLWDKLVMAVMVLGRPLSFLVFPLYFNFVLTFPEPSPVLKKLPWLNHGIRLYLPYLVFGFCGAIVLTAVASISPQEAFALRTSLPGYLVRYGVVLIYIPLIFVSLILSLKARNEITQRRITILAIGILCGLGALTIRAAFLFTLYFLPLEVQSRVPFWLTEALVLVAFSMLTLMPFLVTYAIARRRLIPLNVATRRALRYLGLYAYFGGPSVLLILIVNGILFRVLSASMADAGVAMPLLTMIIVLLLEIFTFATIHQRFIKPRLHRRTANPGYPLRNALPEFGYQLTNLAKAARLRIRGRETYQAVIDQVRSELVNSTDIEDIAHTVCKIIQETWITDNAIIFLNDKNSGSYVCVASKFLAGYNLTRLHMAELILPKDGQIVSDLAARRKRTLEPEDWMGNPELLLAEHRVLSRVHSTLVLPIFIEDQMIGILSLGQPFGEFRYGATLKQTLMDIAAQTASAIEVVSLKSIAGSPHLSKLFENVIKSAMTAVPAQKGSIYLWSENKQVLSMRAQFGLYDHFLNRIELQSGEGFAGLAFKIGKSLIIDDAQTDERGKNMGGDQIKDIQSTICVPLIAWSRVIGVLCLDNIEHTKAFTQMHLDRVTSIASYAAVIVQNTRLQSELRELALYLSPANINREGLKAAEVEGKKDSIGLILTRTFQSIRRITEAKTANLVLLVDPYLPEQSIKQPLAIISAGFEDNEGFSSSIKLKAKGFGQRALENRKAVTVVGLRRFAESSVHFEGSKSRACICLPLEISKYVGGLLYLNYHQPHEFTDAEKTFLSMCADQAALAIANVRQYEELLYTNKVVWMSLMMSNTAHEIRQSTEAMRTLLDVIRRTPGGDLSELMLEMKANLDNIRKLQERSLPSSSDNVKNVVEINKVLESEVQQWCDKGVLDCSELEPDRCFVYIDRKQLSLVLKNLTVNAVRAMDTTSSKRLKVSSKRVGKRIEIWLSNNGKPIPPDVQSILFSDLISKPNITRGRPGIGLFIGRRILRFHEGDLNLVKSDDDGTTFSFWLPTVVAKTPGLAWEAFQNGNL